MLLLCLLQTSFSHPLVLPLKDPFVFLKEMCPQLAWYYVTMVDFFPSLDCCWTFFTAYCFPTATSPREQQSHMTEKDKISLFTYDFASFELESYTRFIVFSNLWMFCHVEIVNSPIQIFWWGREACIYDRGCGKSGFILHIVRRGEAHSAWFFQELIVVVSSFFFILLSFGNLTWEATSMPFTRHASRGC